MRSRALPTMRCRHVSMHLLPPRQSCSRSRSSPRVAPRPVSGPSPFCRRRREHARKCGGSRRRTHWIDTLVRLRDCGQPAVVVTVASTRGSAPREAGTKMIVTAAAVHGTIGGGHLEHKAIAIARDLLIGGANALRRFPLGASLGQCCGGLVHLLFEPVVDAAPWLDALIELGRDGVDGVMVSTTDGLAAAGKLVVASNRAFGSVGGGVEEEVTALGRQMLTSS